MNFEIDFNEKEAEKEIIKALIDIVNNSLSTAASRIKKKIRIIVKQLIVNCPEYQSLVNHGQLQGELGVVDPKRSMEDILNVWVKSIGITLRPAKKNGNDIKAFLDIDILDTSFQNVLSLPAAKYTTEKGQEIPWLQWLLTAGDSIIIRNYDIDFNTMYSRTGLNIMVKNVSSNWRIPPEFSGTIQNNFVTRALQDFDTILNTIVNEEIIKVI